MPQRSIRSLLITTLVGGVLLLSGALIALFYAGSRQAVQSLTAAWIEQMVELTHGRLAAYFQPIQHELLLATDRIASSHLLLEDAAAFKNLYGPLLSSSAQVSSVLVADSGGREFMLSRSNNGLQLRASDAAQHPERALMHHWSTDGRHSDGWINQSYDPRMRPWYQGALQRYYGNPTATRGETYWTAPYTFFSTGQPGITASLAWQAPNGEVYVVGFDIHLRDISRFTTGLTVAEHGLAVVLTDDNRLVGLPRYPRFMDESEWDSALLKTPENINIPLAADAYAAFQGRAPQSGPVRFDSDGVTWWGDAKIFVLDDEKSLIAVAMVPEQDLHRQTQKILAVMAATVLVVLLIALGQAVRLAHRVSRPIERLVSHSERIRAGDLDVPIATDSRVKEINQLALAQERMRTGLRELMLLENDLAVARKIQQNTFPTTFPQIAGYSFAGWSLPADATGGDSYDIVSVKKKAIEQVAFLLADATGHGVGPALSVTQVRAMLRMALRAGIDLPELAFHLNEQLCADLAEGRFITAWIAVLDPQRNLLHSISAGQAPLIHYRAAANAFAVIEANGPPLGILPQIEAARPEVIPLEVGDIFLVVSDGVIEARNAQGDAFGIERLNELVRTNRALNAQEIVEELKIEVVAFCNDLRQDDATLVVIKRGGGAFGDVSPSYKSAES